MCQHRKIRSACKDCGGGSICPHDKIRYYCKACKASNGLLSLLAVAGDEGKPEEEEEEQMFASETLQNEAVDAMLKAFEEDAMLKEEVQDD